MSDNLTALITRVQGQLLDDGTLFSTAALTAAFRSALTRFNQVAPYFKTGTVSVVAGQYVYDLSALTGLLDFFGVWNEDEEQLTVDFFWEDGGPRMRLREPLTSGTLTVRYSIAHTVGGLDGVVTSTLAADQDQVLVDGTCAEAIKARFLTRVEKVNVSAQVLEGYRSAAASYDQAFALGLRRYARRPAGVGAPSMARWADEWEGWDR